jgi:hypothetical protein
MVRVAVMLPSVTVVVGAGWVVMDMVGAVVTVTVATPDVSGAAPVALTTQ